MRQKKWRSAQQTIHDEPSILSTIVCTFQYAMTLCLLQHGDKHNDNILSTCRILLLNIKKKRCMLHPTKQHGSLLSKQPITFTFEAAIQSFLYSLITGFHGVLAPGLSVVAAEDDDLTFLLAERGKVGNLDNHRSGRKEVGG